jgi:hypothetical protein
MSGRISKTNAKLIQHLLSYLLPEHAASHPLTTASMTKIAADLADLADLTAEPAGTRLDGVQTQLEWEHYQPVVISRAEYERLLAASRHQEDAAAAEPYGEATA